MENQYTEIKKAIESNNDSIKRLFWIDIRLDNLKRELEKSIKDN